jgi:hypothetical protein
MKKYLALPGWVHSRTDNDRHYISGKRLIELYGVNPEEVIIANDENLRGLNPNDYIRLFPRYDGDYKL